MSVIIREDKLIRYEDAEAHFIVPQHIRYIEELAFSGAENLVSLELPASVEYIGNYAFRMCYLLQEIVLPETITAAGAGLFQHCWKLRSVKLPEGTKMIGGEMFESCHALTSIEIPDSMLKIERNAFSGCRSLREIVINPSKLSVLPSSARYTAVLTYMERHSEEGGNEIVDQFVRDRQANLLDLAINRRNAEAVRYMLRRDLISEITLKEYMNRSAVRNRVEITALLLDHSHNKEIKRDPFDEDPFK